MGDENTEFGELRALMNTTKRGHMWWKAVRALLDAALERDPTIVRDRWVPYIRGFEGSGARRFRFWKATTPEEFELWSSVFTDTLFELYLFDQRVGDACVERIVNDPSARRIKTLNLGRCNLTSSGYEALAASPHLTSLEQLTLATNAPGARGARALAGMKRLPRLERLHLFANDLDDASLARIVAGLDGAALTHLDASMNTLGGETARGLSETDGLAALERLRLDHTNAGDTHARTLCVSPRLASLELLSLRNCGVTPEGARAMIESVELPALRWLDLEDNDIPWQADAALTQAAKDRGFEVKLRRVEYTDWR